MAEGTRRISRGRRIIVYEKQIFTRRGVGSCCGVVARRRNQLSFDSPKPSKDTFVVHRTCVHAHDPTVFVARLVSAAAV